jgi:rhamnosyltransferase subunit B
VHQLILPFAFDQFDNGRRVQHLNAGSVLPASRANARRLRKEIDRLLARPKHASRWGVPGDLPVASALAQAVDSVEQALARATESPAQAI